MMNAAVILAALGYFVDVFDLLLFSIVRIESLKDLGLQGDELLDQGLLLLNMQMAGMLIGGILWGVLGDKYGRLKVLFGSIITYSLATLLNGFVETIPQYAVLRFIGGVGLAGELGAGITLVSETLDKEKRGLGTTFVAALGVSGAVVAAFVGEIFHWRTCYFIGGGLGLLLLAMRIAVYESGIYERTAQQTHIRKGSFLTLFQSSERIFRYLNCILIGLPTWFVIGILVTFSPEFAQVLGASDLPKPGIAVAYAYVGLVVGDVGSGLLSQYLRSRRKALFLFYAINGFAIVAFLQAQDASPQIMYWLCSLLGFSVGYWAVFVTTASEQFGTNLRATVTTTAPNFVRGSLVPLSYVFNLLKPELGIVNAAYVVGLSSVAIACLSAYFLEESFAKDLDFVEE